MQTPQRQMMKHILMYCTMATSGYSGSELLRLPQDIGMTLMENEAFESLFNRDEDGPSSVEECTPAPNPSEYGTSSPMQHGGIHPSGG